jgi:lactate dehydrogenase-like 2-hydroxyacid dehydrogenase
MRPIVTVTRRLPEAVEQLLSSRYDARLNAADNRLDRDTLSAALTSSDAIVTTLGDSLDRALLQAAPARARMIAHFGAGYDNIDVRAARELGMVVTNTPGVLTDDTADLTLLLLLAVARRAGEGERELRAGAWTGWRPTHLLGTRLAGKTLGLVGFGRIARAVARRAGDGFGMRVLVWSRSLSETSAREARVERRETIEALVRESDFVSLHVPSTPDTRHLLDASRLSAFRPEAFLVNTSRGDVIDERALVDALRRRAIAGAGLDVYEHEPRVSPELLALPNVVLLPHIGSATIESRTAMGMLVAANLEAFFAGREPPNRVA